MDEASREYVGVFMKRCTKLVKLSPPESPHPPGVQGLAHTWSGKCCAKSRGVMKRSALAELDIGHEILKHIRELSSLHFNEFPESLKETVEE